jgi:hypothetical protein
MHADLASYRIDRLDTEDNEAYFQRLCVMRRRGHFNGTSLAGLDLKMTQNQQEDIMLPSNEDKAVGDLLKAANTRPKGGRKQQQMNKFGELPGFCKVANTTDRMRVQTTRIEVEKAKEALDRRKEALKQEMEREREKEDAEKKERAEKRRAKKMEKEAKKNLKDAADQATYEALFFLLSKPPEGKRKKYLANTLKEYIEKELDGQYPDIQSSGTLKQMTPYLVQISSILKNHRHLPVAEAARQARSTIEKTEAEKLIKEIKDTYSSESDTDEEAEKEERAEKRRAEKMEKEATKNLKNLKEKEEDKPGEHAEDTKSALGNESKKDNQKEEEPEPNVFEAKRKKNIERNQLEEMKLNLRRLANEYNDECGLHEEKNKIKKKTKRKKPDEAKNVVESQRRSKRVATLSQSTTYKEYSDSGGDEEDEEEQQEQQEPKEKQEKEDQEPVTDAQQPRAVPGTVNKVASAKWEVGQEAYVCDCERNNYAVYKGTVAYRQWQVRSKTWSLKFGEGNYDYMESEMHTTREAAEAALAVLKQSAPALHATGAGKS